MANFFQGSKGVKRIVLLCVAILLALVFIAVNVVLNIPYINELANGALGGSVGSGGGGNVGNALGSADELVTEIAEESMVLLKNEDGFLPRTKDEKFNLFGWGSTNSGFLLIGGGSGGSPITEAANPYRTTLVEAFEEGGYNYNTELTAKYDAFSDFNADHDTAGSTGANASDSLKNPPASFYTDELMSQAKSYSSTALVVLSRWAAENGGQQELLNTWAAYPNGAYLRLTTEEEAMLDKLEENSFDVVILLNTTNPLELAFLEDYDCIKACLYVGIPGQSGARAIPRILTGEVNPSGRLSDTYAYSWAENNPTYPNTYHQSSNLVYQEGIYFGYKWYETADEEAYFDSKGLSYEEVVQFPFGYGLSYTTFTQEIVDTSWSANEKLEAGKEYSVTVRVTNTGSVAGREVVQLYFTPPYTQGGIEKASINLLAFDKTALLKPASESETESVQDVTLTFTAYELASYDAYDKNGNSFKGYETEAGNYAIKLMKNAHEVIDASNEIACDGLRFEKDPVTGETVENRFTGEAAYAGMPIDGSTGVDGLTEDSYLSRENCFANFPTVRAGTSGGSGSVTAAARAVAGDGSGNNVYNYTGYDGEDISGFDYSQDRGDYLVTLEGGEKASLSALRGDGATLEYNYDLMEALWDYDAVDWDDFLNQLSQADINNVIGNGMFKNEAIESVGKTGGQDRDGPAGFNGSVVSGKSADWTVFPAETLTGCSFSQRLTYNLGQSQGQIANASGLSGWYAPGVNLHRSPYNSRNYEYYSEDGVLSGKLAAETIRGAKEKGLACYLKHFVMSEPGQNAGNWYIWTTEQALRECYLKPFEICVKEGGSNAMMSAFNKLGAIWCGYNHALLTDVLRTEWGFRGTVITDWGQGYMNNYAAAVKAGNDLWLGANTLRLNFNDPGTAYGARESAKSILYTFVDTAMSAKEYQEKVENGEIDDKYNVTLGPTAAGGASSPLFYGLWALVDVVLILGVAACVVFMFLPKGKKQSE